jgi:hypothetical protein
MPLRAGVLRLCGAFVENSRHGSRSPLAKISRAIDIIEFLENNTSAPMFATMRLGYLRHGNLTCEVRVSVHDTPSSPSNVIVSDEPNAHAWSGPAFMARFESPSVAAVSRAVAAEASKCEAACFSFKFPPAVTVLERAKLRELYALARLGVVDAALERQRDIFMASPRWTSDVRKWGGSLIIEADIRRWAP